MSSANYTQDATESAIDRAAAIAPCTNHKRPLANDAPAFTPMLHNRLAAVLTPATACDTKLDAAEYAAPAIDPKADAKLEPPA